MAERNRVNMQKNYIDEQIFLNRQFREEGDEARMRMHTRFALEGLDRDPTHQMIRQALMQRPDNVIDFNLPQNYPLLNVYARNLRRLISHEFANEEQYNQVLQTELQNLMQRFRNLPYSDTPENAQIAQTAIQAAIQSDNNPERLLGALNTALSMSEQLIPAPLRIPYRVIRMASSRLIGNIDRLRGMRDNTQNPVLRGSLDNIVRLLDFVINRFGPTLGTTILTAITGGSLYIGYNGPTYIKDLYNKLSSYYSQSDKDKETFDKEIMQHIDSEKKNYSDIINMASMRRYGYYGENGSNEFKNIELALNPLKYGVMKERPAPPDYTITDPLDLAPEYSLNDPLALDLDNPITRVGVTERINPIGGGEVGVGTNPGFSTVTTSSSEASAGAPLSVDQPPRYHPFGIPINYRLPILSGSSHFGPSSNGSLPVGFNPVLQQLRNETGEEYEKQLLAYDIKQKEQNARANHINSISDDVLGNIQKKRIKLTEKSLPEFNQELSKYGALYYPDPVYEPLNDFNKIYKHINMNNLSPEDSLYRPSKPFEALHE